MIFLLVLAVATEATAAVIGLRHRFSARDAARWVGMAIALGFAGASYLFLATRFIQHLPTWGSTARRQGLWGPRRDAL